MAERTARRRVPALSVVMPALNEQDAIGSTLAELRDAVGGSRNLEVIVVSDGSTDGTFAGAVGAMSALGIRGRVIELAGNVGSHAAIRIGLAESSGAFVAVMAADGQDPPSTIPRMLDAARSGGSDVVWARRTSRGSQGAALSLASRFFIVLFALLTRLRLPPSGLDFVMLSRRAVDHVGRHRERHLPVHLLLFNLPLPRAYVDYERRPRVAGSSRWTIGRRIGLAVDMLASTSMALMRLISVTGVVVGALGLTYGAVTVVRALLGQGPDTGTGWASLMVVVSVIGGLALLGIGLIGEYLWRVLEEVRGRPVHLERARWESA
jgi:glycosyltransferase involved in cell wall biosynthesis